MTDQTTYKVVSSGGVLSPFEEPDVIAAFSKLFSITPEKAASFLVPEKLINQDLTKSKADEYKTKLAELGMPTKVVQETPAVTNTLNATEFTCPKCHLAQAKSSECTGCGIIFEKYKSTATKTVREQLDSNHIPQVNESDESSLPILAFVVPAIAAIVGAFIWKAVALSFGYEIGFLAWAIGGAVGAAAAIVGGRGEVVGGYCAVLALLAIFTGKYMIMSDYQQQMTEMLTGVSGEEIMTELFAETEYDAQEFAKIDKSDNSIKQFMVDYGYTDADVHMFVSDYELQEFRLEVQPWLESDDPTQMYGEAIDDVPTLAAAIPEVSPVHMVFESLGLVDLIFAFLGLSTAFQLGRSGFGRKPT